MAKRQRSRFPFDQPTPVDLIRDWSDPSIEPPRYPTRSAARRVVHGRAPDISFRDQARAFLSSDWHRAAVDTIKQNTTSAPVGRPRRLRVADWSLMHGMTWKQQSHRAVFREMKDAWGDLRRFTRKLYPSGSPYRLSRRPADRTAWQRFRRDHIESNPGLLDKLEFQMSQIHLSLARGIGLLAPESGSWSNLASTCIARADGTWIESRFRHPGPLADPNTGEVLRDARDPEARRQPGSEESWGQNWVHLIVRSQHAGERVIIDAQTVPAGLLDGTVGTNLALALKDRAEGLRALVYDMHLPAADQERLYSAGIIPIVKADRTARKRAGNLRQGKLPKQQDFDAPDGTTSQHAVYVVDGTPCIRLPIGGQEHAVPLVGGQVHWRGNRCYRYWSLPDTDVIPPTLRRATTRIRHNSTREEKDRDDLRTLNLRLYPESDPDFDRLYGYRQDTEAMHADLKSRLIARRARSINLTRQRLDMIAWAIFTNIRAAVAYRARTGRPPPVLREQWSPQQAAA